MRHRPDPHHLTPGRVLRWVSGSCCVLAACSVAGTQPTVGSISAQLTVSAEVDLGGVGSTSWMASSSQAIVVLGPNQRLSLSGVVHGPLVLPAGFSPSRVASSGQDFIALGILGGPVALRFDALGNAQGFSAVGNCGSGYFLPCFAYTAGLDWNGTVYEVRAPFYDLGLSDPFDDKFAEVHSQLDPISGSTVGSCNLGGACAANIRCNLQGSCIAANPTTTASDGVGFLSVSSTGADNDITGQLRSANGGYLGAPFVISAAPGIQDQPAIAFDGVQYAVVWRDSRNGQADIYANWVDANGVVLESSDTPVSADPGNELWPSIAPAGPQRVAVVYSRSTYKLRFLTKASLAPGDACAQATECASSVCEGGHCCNEPCVDDGEPCTTTSCAAGACSNALVPDGAACPSGTCLAGVCQSSAGPGGSGGAGGAAGAGGDAAGGAGGTTVVGVGGSTVSSTTAAVGAGGTGAGGSGGVGGEAGAGGTSASSTNASASSSGSGGAAAGSSSSSVSGTGGAGTSGTAGYGGSDASGGTSVAGTNASSSSGSQGAAGTSTGAAPDQPTDDGGCAVRPAGQDAPPIPMAAGAALALLLVKARRRRR